jgi:hypothetical protein
LAVFVEELAFQFRAVAVGRYGQHEKPAAWFGHAVGLGDGRVWVGGLGVAGQSADAGIGVDQCAAGKLLKAQRID